MDKYFYDFLNIKPYKNRKLKLNLNAAKFEPAPLGNLPRGVYLQIFIP